jgi:hypothetical protein
MSWVERGNLAEPRRIFDWTWPGLAELDFNKITVKNDRRILFYSETDINLRVATPRRWYAVWVAGYGQNLKMEHYFRPDESRPPSIRSSVDEIYRNQIWTLGDSFIIQLKSESRNGGTPMDVVISRTKEELDALLSVVYGINKPVISVAQKSAMAETS